MKYQKGFTLVETIIYLAIFAIIMMGIITAIYGIFSSSAHNNSKAMVQEEGNYLLSKIEWALSGIQGVSVIGLDEYNGDAILITKNDPSQGPITVFLSDGNLLLTKNSGTYTLNNDNTIISCFPSCFTYTSSAQGSNTAEKIEVSFTITAKTSEGLSYAQTFYTVKYMR